MLLPPGGHPSGCANCTPALERHSAPWLASPVVRGLRELFHEAYDAAIDKLSRVL